MAKRPDATTMEGMLWNSLKVLEKALEPDAIGIPKSLFLDCKGIVILTIVEAGFIFKGSVGTGIIMSRLKENEWSPPSAVGMAGVGFGFLAGAAMKNLILFIMDEATLKSYSGEISLEVGTQANLTIGTFGRDAEVALHASDKGVGGAVAVAFSKGAFAAAAIEGGSLKPRHQANEDFYGEKVTPQDILFEKKVEIPSNTIIPEIHEMLEGLADGSSWLLTESAKEKIEAARVDAVKKGEKTRESDNDGIQYVDAAKEAEKEEKKKAED